jgi:hypothetical protein
MLLSREAFSLPLCRQHDRKDSFVLVAIDCGIDLALHFLPELMSGDKEDKFMSNESSTEIPLYNSSTV